MLEELPGILHKIIQKSCTIIIKYTISREISLEIGPMPTKRLIFPDILVFTCLLLHYFSLFGHLCLNGKGGIFF